MSSATTWKRNQVQTGGAARKGFPCCVFLPLSSVCIQCTLGTPWVIFQMQSEMHEMSFMESSDLEIGKVPGHWTDLGVIFSADHCGVNGLVWFLPEHARTARTAPRGAMPGQRSACVGEASGKNDGNMCDGEGGRPNSKTVFLGFQISCEGPPWTKMMLMMSSILTARVRRVAQRSARPGNHTGMGSISPAQIKP